MKVVHPDVFISLVLCAHAILIILKDKYHSHSCDNNFIILIPLLVLILIPLLNHNHKKMRFTYITIIFLVDDNK